MHQAKVVLLGYVNHGCALHHTEIFNLEIATKDLVNLKKL